MERPDLTFLNRPRAELRRLGALVSIVIAGGTGLAAGVAVSARAGAEQSYTDVHSPNDPYYIGAMKTGYERADVNGLWALQKPAGQQVCADIEPQGSALVNEDLHADRLTLVNPGPVMDHPTVVTQAMAAENDNNWGGVSVAGDLCRVVEIPIPPTYTSLATSVGEAIHTAVDDYNAKIINIEVELTGDQQSAQNLIDAEQYAVAKDRAVVAPAGNDGIDLAKNPGGDVVSGLAPPDVMDVGSLNKTYSNYNNSRLNFVYVPDVTYTVNAKGEFITDAGTSLASPRIVGLYAWMFSCNPNLRVQDANKIIIAHKDSEGVPDFRAAALDAGCHTAPKPPTTSTNTTTTPTPKPNMESLKLVDKGPGKTVVYLGNKIVRTIYSGKQGTYSFDRNKLTGKQQLVVEAVANRAKQGKFNHFATQPAKLCMKQVVKKNAVDCIFSAPKAQPKNGMQIEVAFASH